MRRAGVTDYEAFAKALVERIPDAPISFEVFSDDFEDMKRQARKIATWGKNVYVKIPITNTKGESSLPMVRELAAEGVIDPKRVCIAGASYGGYAALAGAAFEPDTYRCAASVAGPSDLKRLLQYTATATGSRQGACHLTAPASSAARGWGSPTAPTSRR